MEKGAKENVIFSVVEKKGEKVVEAQKADANRELMAEAYAWALETQKNHGYYSEPIHLYFPDDHLDDGNGECIISLFVDDYTKKAILRRDWPEDMCLKFNKITNLDEIRHKAPKAYALMVQNGLEMYHREGGAYKAYYRQQAKKARK